MWPWQHPAGGFEQTGGATASDAAPDAAVPAAHSLRLARAVIKMLADGADEVRLLPPTNQSDGADGAAGLGDDELRTACEVVSGKVFGVSLPALVERRRKMAGVAEATVPEVLPELFALVEKKGGHRLEGIFRLSAAKEKTGPGPAFLESVNKSNEMNKYRKKHTYYHITSVLGPKKYQQNHIRILPIIPLRSGSSGWQETVFMSRPRGPPPSRPGPGGPGQPFVALRAGRAGPGPQTTYIYDAVKHLYIGK